ncbi:hypothetical protein [Cellulosimicrobium cellulans]|uniref:hypothetical protein n=1 Tax=Cellulosimicrobium cellulans TaxID=1710 RepID=UPI001BAA256F|nr:hypothetical protein [Cellulosimicrobium cellulans]QUC01205.1 hypothetical protein J5A69_08605 [Cellulosimicrobium cellulans]
MTNTDHPTLTNDELDALPLGARVGFTDARGCPGAAVKVGTRQSSGSETFSITGPTCVSAFAVSRRRAVLLEPAQPAPSGGDVQIPAATLTGPDQVASLPARAVLRDASGTVVENAGGPRPWLPTGFSEGIESAALAYPVTVLWPTPPPIAADRALAAHHVEAARHRFASDPVVSKYNPELQAVRRSVLRVLDATIKTIRDGSEAGR